MLGRTLVRPLEQDWAPTLDEVARARGWPTSRDVARLGASVAALSASYNDPSRARASVRDAGAARLGFSFPRDVPKGAAAVRELVATRRLAFRAGLRILDLGAGMGATTWGVVRALEASGGGAGVHGAIDVVWVDADAPALEVAQAIARARAGLGAIELRVRAVARSIGASFDDQGRFDLVLAGQVLSELDVGVDASVRAARHAELLAGWLDRNVAPGGSLVVVEPALRERSRHLHRVRDALVARGATVFAPCLHAGACPALARESDWCHEDLDVDLPPWLLPVARAAGLRREGLTFAYLVLRRDGATLRGDLAAAGAPLASAPLRRVSEAIVSKGKTEAFLCGEVGAEDGGLVAARVRVTRLDREASPANAPWQVARRGDILLAEPPIQLERARIGRESRLILATDSETH